MKVLMISGDKNVLLPNTRAYERLQLQKKAVEQLDVFVWPQVHSQWRIWLATRKHRYDVITTQDPFWRGLLGWKFARLTGAKLNVQVHADLAGQSFIKRTLARFVLRRADSVRVVSEKVKEQVLAYGTSASITVLPVYIDVEKFRQAARQPHEQKTILWIGRLEKEKSPEMALQILQEVREKEKIDAGLVVIGEGSLGEKLLVSAHNLKHLRFEGWQDPMNYFDKADVVVCTSFHESWGASIVEALAAGIPVVAPDVGIAREAGAIVVPREDLGKAVTEVLKTSPQGELKLKLPTAEEWVKQWRASLT